MKFEPREDCIICGEEIPRYPNSRTIKSRRGSRSVTCSKKCSRIYIRVFRFVYEKLRRKNNAI